jgi:hypothetical protein
MKAAEPYVPRLASVPISRISRVLRKILKRARRRHEAQVQALLTKRPKPQPEVLQRSLEPPFSDTLLLHMR